FAQVQQRLYVDFGGDVEMRNLLLALDHPRGDTRTQLGGLDHFHVGTARYLALGRRWYACGGCSSTCRRSRRREILHVGFHDAPTGTCSLHLTQINAALAGDLASDRRRLHAAGKCPVNVGGFFLWGFCLCGWRSVAALLCH